MKKFLLFSLLILFAGSFSFASEFNSFGTNQQHTDKQINFHSLNNNYDNLIPYNSIQEEQKERRIIEMETKINNYELERDLMMMNKNNNFNLAF